jgi:hypothetical protein
VTVAARTVPATPVSRAPATVAPRPAGSDKPAVTTSAPRSLRRATGPIAFRERGAKRYCVVSVSM